MARTRSAALRPLLLALFCAAVKGEVTCPISPETTVAYFAGHGATSDCQDWEKHFFDWWGRSEPRVVVQRMTAAATKSCDLAQFPNL
jgi:hypothetical protein